VLDFLRPQRSFTDLVSAVNTMRIRVTTMATHTGALLQDSAHIIRDLHKLKEIIVANFAELNAALDAHNTALTGAVQRVNDDVQALKDQIDRLQLDTDDQAQVDAAVARVQSAVDALNAVDPVTAEVPVEPTPEQPQV